MHNHLCVQCIDASAKMKGKAVEKMLARKICN